MTLQYTKKEINSIVTDITGGALNSVSRQGDLFIPVYKGHFLQTIVDGTKNLYGRTTLSLSLISIIAGCGTQYKSVKPDAVIDYRAVPIIAEKADPQVYEKGLTLIYEPAFGKEAITPDLAAKIDASDGVTNETEATNQDNLAATYSSKNNYGLVLPAEITLVGTQGNSLDLISKLSAAEAQKILRQEISSKETTGGVILYTAGGNYFTIPRLSGTLSAGVYLGAKNTLTEIIGGKSYSNIDVWGLLQNGREIARVNYYPLGTDSLKPADNFNSNGYERSIKIYSPQDLENMVKKELNGKPLSHLENKHSPIRAVDIPLAILVGAAASPVLGAVDLGANVFVNSKYNNGNSYLKSIKIDPAKNIDSVDIFRFLNPEFGTARVIQPIYSKENIVGLAVYDFTKPDGKAILTPETLTVTEKSKEFAGILEKLGIAGLIVLPYHLGKDAGDTETITAPIKSGGGEGSGLPGLR